MKQFLPGPYPLKYKIKRRLRKQPDYDYKFFKRSSKKLNIMEKIFSKLHYLGSHSYVTNKWHKQERKFFNQHPKRF